MAILSTGKTFGTTEEVTATKLNNIADAATFDDPVDDSTLELHTDGKLRVKDSGVTKAKIENVADMKVLGNTSGSATAPEEVSILDEDDMTSDSATSLATQQSIKAYVDGEITDHGITQSTGTAPYYGVRAWAYYNGTSNTLVESGNISSVTKNGTGDYTFTFDTAMPDNNYAVLFSSSNEANVNHGVGFVESHATDSCRIQFYDPTNGSNKTDKSYVAMSVIR